jgi:hypothetical protein
MDKAIAEQVEDKRQARLKEMRDDFEVSREMAMSIDQDENDLRSGLTIEREPENAES